MSAMNILMFAGSAQFVMVDMWQAPLSVVAVSISVFIINLRYLLIGASLRPVFSGYSLMYKATFMHLVADDTPTWHTPVLTCSSVTHGGTRAIWETVLEHREKFRGTGEFDQRRREQSLEWMWTLVDEGLKRRFKENEAIRAKIPGGSLEVENQKISPSAAARALLACL